MINQNLMTLDTSRCGMTGCTGSSCSIDNDTLFTCTTDIGAYHPTVSIKCMNGASDPLDNACFIYVSYNGFVISGDRVPYSTGA